MMISPAKRLLACAAIAVGATAVAGPLAYADTGSTSPSPTPTATQPGGDALAAVKARAASAISARTSALQAAVSSVEANKYLTSSDRSAILSTLNSDLSGLTALAPVIQADTTLAQARSDFSSIFTKYRVFALAIPQARFVTATDDLTGTVVPRLTDAQTRLESLLSGRDSGKDTAAVQAAMTDLGNRISGITSDTNGLAATVLGYTPADWNANHSLLSPARSKLQDARSDAKAARNDIRTVVQAIRS